MRLADGDFNCGRCHERAPACSCGPRVSRPCDSVPKLIDSGSGCLMLGRSRHSGTRPKHCRRRTAAPSQCRYAVADPGSARRAARARPSGSGAPTQISWSQKAIASEMSAGAASAWGMQWPHPRLAHGRPRTHPRVRPEYRRRVFSENAVGPKF
jgi:hypothetical protein